MRAANCGSVDSKAHIHEPAVGNALYAEAAEKGAEFRRTLLIFQAADGECFGGPVGRSVLRPRAEAAAANGLQGQGFTRQDFRLRLDIVLDIHLVAVRIHALERQDAGIRSRSISMRAVAT